MEKSLVEQAVQRRQRGYNCCQAVVCTYSELLGLPEEDAYRASEGFGVGISGMQETCGSVCAMVMLAGLKNSSGCPAPATQRETYALGRKMAERFREMNTSIVCRELRGNGGVKLRSCRGCVEDCAWIVEETLFPGRFEPYDRSKDKENVK